VGAALVGREILSVETPHERLGASGWARRLAGRHVEKVDARGKHLFLRFAGGLTLHSHLRMTGWWGVYARGGRWGRSPRRAWLVLRTADHDVVQFDGPVLELMREGRSRFDQRLAGLGPDVLAPEWDERAFLARLRDDDPTRGIGDALLDQRNLAGMGNIWKSEGCFLGGIDPWRPLCAVSEEEALGIVRAARPLMRASAERGRVATVEPDRPARRGERRTWVYGRAGLPCLRCGTTIRARGQGEDNRSTFWCPACQA
jgi:endonuclease-8